MKTTIKFGFILGVIAVLTLAGCAGSNTRPYPPSPNVASSGHAYSDYGIVQSIELVQEESNGIGLGTIAGAVIGGVLGNQVGAGRGNTVATVAGVAGGAYVGHELEKRQQHQNNAYRIGVRMDDGSYQALMQSTDSGLRIGDRVFIQNGSVHRY